jgi:hypothetical protein
VTTESTHEAAKAAVLGANAVFYRAFTDGDYAAMSDLWAERAPISCLHPGAPPLIGRNAVLDGWKKILGGTSRFELCCRQPVVHVTGEAAIVTCYEASDDQPAHLAATNVFVTGAVAVPRATVTDAQKKWGGVSIRATLVRRRIAA